MRALRNSRLALPLALVAAALVAGCVCCTGGLADALSPPVAIGFLGATVLFAAAAATVAAIRIRRPFRAVRKAVGERLEWLTSLHADVVRYEGGPAIVTGYRINRIHIDWSDGEAAARVIATLAFDDGSSGTLFVDLYSYGEQWQIEQVQGLGFELPQE